MTRNPVTAELGDMARALQLVGVPAVLDPGEVLSVLPTLPVVLLLGPVAEYTAGMGMATVDLGVTVQLLTAGPDDLAASDRLEPALLAAMPLAPPDGVVSRDTTDLADTTFPCLRWTTRRRIPYPPTVNP